MAEKPIELKNDAILVGPLYSFSGIVKEVKRDGDEINRKPIIVILQDETTRRVLEASAWDFSALNVFKTACEKRSICNFTFKAKNYRDTVAMNLQSVEVTDKISELPKDAAFEESDTYQHLKEWISQMVQDYVTNENYVKIIDILITNNTQFFTWKAAKALHHAFNGGLALHSYMVTMNAISSANLYNNPQGLKLDYSLLVTGALLHDIGKLIEYTSDGEISFYGNLLSHMVTGIELIDDACDKAGIDKYSNDIVKLKHIIASHHGKLEYGSPNLPVLPEAWLVSRADKADAENQAMIEALESTPTGRATGPIRCLDGGKVYKLYNDEE